MTIEKFEKYIDHKIFDLIFNGLELNETAGHPLFSNNDPAEAFNLINKIKNIMNVINKKLAQSKIDKTYNIKFNNKNLEAEKYEISFSLNKFGLNDIINAPNARLNLSVYNIINADKLNDHDYNTLYVGSSGTLRNYSNDSVSGKNFITREDKMNITCYAIDGKILPHSFLPVFLHEYLHFYENYNRSKQNTNKENIKNLRLHKSINDKFSYLENELTADQLKSLDRILYVFFYGEDNARIGNLFGHLISYNITSLKDFHDNKNNIYYFKEYENLKKHIEIVKTIDANIYHYLFSNSNFFRDENKRIKDISFMTDYKVKKWFIDIIELKLKKYYEKGMKFVGRYIQMIDEYNDKNFVSRFTFDEDYNNEFVNNLISEK